MNFPSLIFLDGGSPEEAKKADELLKNSGHPGIQGQTTNPSLIARSALKKLKFHGSPRVYLRTSEALAFYRQTVEEMAGILAGPISVQVIGDTDTSYKEYLRQGQEILTWIPNAVVKFPCTYEGLKAASIACHHGPVNMTLAFSQTQAAAVYTATRNSKHPVYISPFVGRLDDQGLNGMALVANILRMYRSLGDGHVKVIAASIRRIDHIIYAISLACDIISIPFSVLTAWVNLGFPVPHQDFVYDTHHLIDIPYVNLLLTRDYLEYAYDHEMTFSGVSAFFADWQKALGKSK